MTVSHPSQIERSIFLRAPRERVWRALTDIREFGAWFRVEASGAFAPGAQLRMTSTHPSCPGLQFEVVIEQMDAPRLFSWLWHPGAVDPAVDYSKEPYTRVEFRLEEAPGGTTVTVLESGFDQISLDRRARVYEDNNQGW